MINFYLFGALNLFGIFNIIQQAHFEVLFMSFLKFCSHQYEEHTRTLDLYI